MAEENNTVDLNGAYHHKVDAKGRMSLPAQFRKVLSTDLVVTRNPLDECLLVFEPKDFNTWVDQLLIDHFGTFNSSKKEHVSARRVLKTRARAVELDASGRIMLPADQREAANIEKDVVVIGNTGYFEIWDAKRYDKMVEEVDLADLFS